MTDNDTPAPVAVPQAPAVLDAVAVSPAVLLADAVGQLLPVALLRSDVWDIAERLRAFNGPAAKALADRFVAAVDAAEAEAELFAGIHRGYGSRSEGRQRCERRNVAAIVDALLAAGYELNLNNGGDGHEAEDVAGLELPAWTRDRRVILAEMFATDDETLCARLPGSEEPKRRHGVYFVYGNADDGSEVASDWHCSLSAVVDPIVDSFPGSDD